MTTDGTTSQLKEKRLSELSRFSDDLEGRSAADILGWAASYFGKGLTFATGFGIEGCVLINLIGKHKIYWQWIKGHSGHKHNEQADYLARKFIQEHQR